MKAFTLNWGASALALLALSIVLPVSAAPASSDCQAVHFDFNSPSELDHFILDAGGLATVENGNLLMTLDETHKYTTLNYSREIPFGLIRTRLQAGPTDGVVTAFTLRGTNKDEVDLEWIGVNTDHVESTFFSKGKDVPGQSDMGKHKLSNGDASAAFFEYAIELTPTIIKYSVEGKVVRTIQNKNDGKFPVGANRLLMGLFYGYRGSDRYLDFGVCQHLDFGVCFYQHLDFGVCFYQHLDFGACFYQHLDFGVCFYQHLGFGICQHFGFCFCQHLGFGVCQHFGFCFCQHLGFGICQHFGFCFCQHFGFGICQHFDFGVYQYLGFGVYRLLAINSHGESHWSRAIP
ncbi:putative glycosidase CRH2 [Tieghemiomyces parasiticus]|uniref:Glycosidase CRH2 n=1 Tax=Tieghemiomyces parasiticus TaxID=78921 RepID=A0A9W7ZT64_9FUNG|nr:putative glycosidase CRH2 [Tieghemiomyces parasiticus]